MSAAPRQAGMPVGFVVVGSLLILALIGVGIYAWRSLSDVEMDAAGYVAMVAGVIVTIGLGVGLMALVFYSDRHGYDRQPGSDDPPG